MSKSFIPQGFPHVKVLTHPYVMRAIFIFITKMRDGSKAQRASYQSHDIYIYLEVRQNIMNSLHPLSH